jgi:CRISPR-associated endonuclease/helicase Cas3
MEYLAHFDRDTDRKQSVSEHLHNSANLAEQFASAFGGGKEAYYCGLMHDIGKYSDNFQKRIRGASIKVDHSTAGSKEAFSIKDVAASFCIAGHHGGIPDRGERTDTADSSTLMGRLKRNNENGLPDYSAFRSEIESNESKTPDRFTTSRETAFFYTHMLFSCLVDADWLDTESFANNGKVKRETGESLSVLRNKLNRYISPWWESNKPINVRRCRILRELINDGRKSQGLYTLTVPTGGGKTVGSMAFAINHAILHGQKRIIYVIPYISIIEQTQRVFESVFGKESVVAHYANVSYDTNENGEITEIDKLRYLATENWDAPIIITTAVQFFESLFGNRPSSCRKLHNIAESTIIFDEAQTLPVNYIYPCIWSITELVKNYGCTAVLCTATQPALESIIKEFYSDDIEELCSDTESNYEFFKRVKYSKDGILSDQELSEQLSANEQVLCVVNSRKQAQTLYEMLPDEGKFHLSTTMIPIHRKKVLDEIRKRLKEGKPCRVVSTSLIEAGVDVDFPSVYRAVAGLDSIIQAGGRCNREGTNSTENSVVHVFDTEVKPPRMLEQNISAARKVMDKYDDISSLEAVQEYFKCLLVLKGESVLDEKSIMKMISNDMAFASVAQKFKLIETNTITLYVPVGEGKKLINELLSSGPDKELMRELGLYSVSIYDNQYKKFDDAGYIQKISKNAAVLLNEKIYNCETGLQLDVTGGEALFI